MVRFGALLYLDREIPIQRPKRKATIFEGGAVSSKSFTKIVSEQT